MEYEISSVIEYLKIVEELKKKDISMLFRGQADACWDPIPSIYREKHYSGKEEDLLVDIRKHNFPEFKEQELFLGELIKMQHSGIPTNLLDWTNNPLNALFFAVSGELDQNGHVIVQFVDEVLKFDQDRYKRLSKFLKAIYNNDFSTEYIDDKAKNFLFEFMDNFCNEVFIDPVYENQRIRVQDGLFSVNILLSTEILDEFKNDLMVYILDKGLRSDILSVYDNEVRGQIFRSEYHKIVDNDSIIEYYNFHGERHMSDVVQNIKGRIHEEGNEEEIEPILEKFYEKISKRIKLIEAKMIKSIDDGEYYSKAEVISKINNNSQGNHHEILILAKNKENILKELDEVYRINSSTIYPDTEGLVQYLKNKYC